MYSNPPVHGARIVANVVGEPALFNEWKAEMELMAGRIKNVRQKLYDSLSAKDKSGKDWSFVLKQIGMFSFTGLNKAQVYSYSHFLPFLGSCLYPILFNSEYNRRILTLKIITIPPFYFLFAFFKSQLCYIFLHKFTTAFRACHGKVPYNNFYM